MNINLDLHKVATTVLAGLLMLGVASWNTRGKQIEANKDAIALLTQRVNDKLNKPIYGPKWQGPYNGGHIPQGGR